MRLALTAAITLLALMTGTAALAAETIGERHLPTPKYGQLVIDEDLLAAFWDEPADNFESAREHFMDADYQAASKSIHKGAAFLRLEAAQGDSASAVKLLTLADEMDQLGIDVSREEVPNEDILDRAFARVHQAEAEHHRKRATEANARGEMEQAGRHLDAAAGYLEHAMRSSRAQDAQTAAEVDSARAVSRRLLEDGRWTADEVAKAIDGIADGLARLAGAGNPPAKKEDASSGKQP